MTNEQKYKTTESVEKPKPCPFCHSETEIVSSNNIYQVSCVHCLYLSEGYTNEESAIAAHNRVARAVEAIKKGDMK